ncbi:MAG: YdeI/OmpD-associated family protein [Candidatus Saccharimonadia bacterium]
MAIIHFETKLFMIGSMTILRLPEDVSAKLPSRGLVMISGTIDGVEFQTALEPDGRSSHWFEFGKTLQAATQAKAGSTVHVVFEPTRAWTEPKVPADILKGIAHNPEVQTQWSDITPMARWEWIRWIRATNRTETRNRRIEVACSKLKAGERRPCCFNASMCTDPTVSKNGVLLEPLPVT